MKKSRSTRSKEMAGLSSVKMSKVRSGAGF